MTNTSGKIGRHILAIAPHVMLALGLIVTVVGWAVATHNANNELSTEFNNTATGYQTALDNRMRRYEQLLLTASGPFNSPKHKVTREDFHALYESMRTSSHSPGMQGLGYIEIISKSQKASVERRVRAEGFPDFTIRPPGERNQYAALIYIEPFSAKNRRAFGFDLLSEIIRSTALNRARDMAEPAMTAKVALSTETDATPQPGFSINVPIYRVGQDIASTDAKRAALTGYISSAFRAKDLMHGIFNQDVFDKSRLRLYDGSTTNAASLMFDSHPATINPKQGLHAERKIPLMDHNWVLAVDATPAYIASHTNALPKLIFGAGLILNALLFALLQSLAAQRRRAQIEAISMSTQLDEASAKFQRVVDATPCGIIMANTAGEIIFGNTEAARMFGYTTLQGLNVDVLLPEAMRAAHVGHRLHYAHAPEPRSMGGNKRLLAMRQDGSLFPVEVGLNPLHTDGGLMMVAAVQDVTARDAATQAIAKAQTQLASVINAASNFSIIATDTAGLITIFSKGAERLLGYSSDEVVGKSTPASLHKMEEVIARGRVLSLEFGETTEGFDVFTKKARETGSESREWTYVCKNGSHVPVNLTVNVVRSDGDNTILGYIGVAYDITIDKLIVEQQSEARRCAEEASRAKSDFLANMSHEIRTPLNGVLGMAQVLANTKLDSTQHEQVQLILHSGRSLMDVLNDVLDFSKIEAGRMDITHEHFEIAELIDDVASLMAINASSKDLALYIDIDPDVPNRLIGDALRLKQILINLTGNAIKFTAQGAITVKVGIKYLSADSATLRCTVNDTGIGISDEQAGRLFNAFSQADSSTTRRFGGTGLGLAICKRITQLMGGDIGVHGKSGVGSEFWFTAKVGLVPAEQDTHTPTAPIAGLNKLRLLSDAASHSDAHSRFTTSVATVGNAAEQLGFTWSSTPFTPNAPSPSTDTHDAYIITGLDKLASIRSIAASLRSALGTRNAPLIALTTPFGREKLLKEISENDARIDSVLTQPVTPSRLHAALKMAVENRNTLAMSNDSTRAQPLRATAPTQAIGQLAGIHLLLVEDNRINQVVARGLLEPTGATLDIANHGQEALDKLREFPERYTAVLMDIQMPVLDGLSATRLIRSELKLTLPIIAMTAGVLSSERDKCFDAGMDGFVSKPIDIGNLIDAIQALLGSSPAIARIEPAKASPLDNNPYTLASESALRRLGDNTELYTEILQHFCEEARDMSAKIQTLLAQGDSVALGRLFHTLKSTAGSMGAETLAHTAERANAASHTPEGVSAELVTEIEEGLKGTSAAIEKYLAVATQ